MFNGFDRSTVALVKRREFPLRRPHMAQKADSTDLVTFKELLMANSFMADALVQLLIEKGIITQNEFFEKLKMVQEEYQSRQRS